MNGEILDKETLHIIEKSIGEEVRDIKTVSGGDISSAFRIASENGKYFCKINIDPSAKSFFLTESEGLKAISETGTISVPQIMDCLPMEKGAILLMEHIESKIPEPKDMVYFAEQLAALHSNTSHSGFGWKRDNFIGKLPQSNTFHLNWVDFFVKQRLLPQLDLAIKRGELTSFEAPGKEQIAEFLNPFYEGVEPSLLHGDLWGGNYLIREDGVPYLIDPAVYYGHAAVDIAMTRLFGGFEPAFYRTYYQNMPEEPLEVRDMYQLYYLLVHLNMFGVSYKASVMRIIRKYFRQ